MSRPCDDYLRLVCTKHQPVLLPIVPYDVDDVLQLPCVIREDIYVLSAMHTADTQIGPILKLRFEELAAVRHRFMYNLKCWKLFCGPVWIL